MRPTDAQLQQWLDNAEGKATEWDSESFPAYYNPDYADSLAVLLGELLELRKVAGGTHPSMSAPVDSRLHWIIAFTEPSRRGLSLSTADGLVEGDMFATRRELYRWVVAEVKATYGLSDDAVVTFFAVEPNALAGTP